MKQASRYDDPDYQKRVALQMLGTPSLLIACQAITDQREQIKNDQVYIGDLLQRIKDLEHLYDVAHGSDSPENHFNYFMQELDKRFPDMKNHVRNKARVDLTLAEIDKKIAIEKQFLLLREDFYEKGTLLGQANAKIADLQKDADELNALKRQVVNIFTGGKLFPGAQDEK